VLIVAQTTGYQTRAFEEAASRLGVELAYATDRCDRLDDPWRDGAIAVRFHDAQAAGTLATALADRPVRGVLAVGDRPTLVAAGVAERLGLRWHSPRAAAMAHDKRRMREALAAAGLPVPPFFTVPADADPHTLVPRVQFPGVVKPTILSASRGVIRVDDPDSFVAAFRRLRALLDAPDVREMRDPQADVVQIERYIPGREYAVEALMDRGALRVLAIFDKPDPLEGPFFEETIYVTPSRAEPALLSRLERAVADAAQALGLSHGPVHAECRVNDTGVYILEAAARPIGGLCARALRFTGPGGGRSTLEELLLRHALGESTTSWTREADASAVMMIPIPRAGVLRRVEGIDAAERVAGTEAVVMTAKPDQRLVPLPEGASYLGFIFARAASPAGAEAAVRQAHAALRFTIDPEIPVVAAGSS
jgi:biotin carboxylase